MARASAAAHAGSEAVLRLCTSQHPLAVLQVLLELQLHYINIFCEVDLGSVNAAYAMDQGDSSVMRDFNSGGVPLQNSESCEVGFWQENRYRYLIRNCRRRFLKRHIPISEKGSPTNRPNPLSAHAYPLKFSRFFGSL